jgi:O-antigen ligase
VVTSALRADRPASSPGPAADRGPRRPAYLWCFLALLVCNVFSGHWDLLGLPIGLDRLFFGLGLVLLVLDPWAWRSPLRVRPVHVAMFALLALVAVSAAGHSTLLSSLGLFAMLDRLIVPFLMFCLAPVVFNTAERRDLLLKTLVFLGLYLGATAILETLQFWSYVWPQYIGNPDVGIQFGRARGPFVASEAMGMACSACAFAGAVAALRWRGAWRAIAVISVALSSAGVLMSLTRSVWVGTVLGIILAMMRSPRSRRLLPAVLAVTAIVVLVLLVVVPGLSDNVLGRLGTTRSVQDRQNTNAAALRIVEQHPLTGVGWSKFIEVAPDWVRQADSYPVTNVAIEVHNVVLSRAAELGLPGAGLFIACILAGPWRAVMQRRRPGVRGEDLAGWWAISAGVTAVWSVTIMLSPTPYPLPNSLVWLLAGISLTPYLLESRDDEPRAAVGERSGQERVVRSER